MAAQVALRRQQESEEAGGHIPYNAVQFCHFNSNVQKASRIIPPSPTSPKEGQLARTTSMSSRSSSPGNEEMGNGLESPASSANESGEYQSLFLPFIALFSFAGSDGKESCFRSVISFVSTDYAISRLLVLLIYIWHILRQPALEAFMRTVF